MIFFFIFFGGRNVRQQHTCNMHRLTIASSLFLSQVPSSQPPPRNQQLLGLLQSNHLSSSNQCGTWVGASIPNALLLVPCFSRTEAPAKCARRRLEPDVSAPFTYRTSTTHVLSDNSATARTNSATPANHSQSTRRAPHDYKTTTTKLRSPTSKSGYCKTLSLKPLKFLNPLRPRASSRPWYNLRRLCFDTGRTSVPSIQLLHEALPPTRNPFKHQPHTLLTATFHKLHHENLITFYCVVNTLIAADIKRINYKNTFNISPGWGWEQPSRAGAKGVKTEARCFGIPSRRLIVISDICNSTSRMVMALFIA